MNEQKDRLAQARKNAGYATAISATTRNNWNYSTYSQHERGQRGITRKAAKKYAEAYNVSAGWLLTGETGLSGEPAGGIDEALMAKVITGVERAGTQDGAKLTPEAKARIIIRLYSKMGAANSEPRGQLVEAIRDEVESQGLEDLFQLYLRHNHGCTDLAELSDDALPEALSVVTCWGFVLAGQSQAGKSATG